MKYLKNAFKTDDIDISKILKNKGTFGILLNKRNCTKGNFKKCSSLDVPIRRVFKGRKWIGRKERVWFSCCFRSRKQSPEISFLAHSFLWKASKQQYQLFAVADFFYIYLIKLYSDRSRKISKLYNFCKAVSVIAGFIF